MESAWRQSPEASMLPNPVSSLGGRFDLQRAGYIAEEFVLQGEATSFEACAAGASDCDEHVTRASATNYCTRLMVFRPIDPARYCGTTIVEWLNVRHGGDIASEWTRTHRHIMRKGMIWVGVSAQRAGVEGDAARIKLPHLKALDPKRYANLDHPGDAFSFDIFSQAGLLIKRGALSFAPPTCMLAVGFSEAARYLTTYANLIDARARAFDGFLIGGRHRSAASLSGASVCGQRVPLRDGLRVPVFVVQSETDPFGRMQSSEVRQADTDRFRLWEIAGAAHVDTYLNGAGQIDDGLFEIADLAAAYAPERAIWVWPRFAMNASPAYHYVEMAALHHLEVWARTGQQPPAGAILRGAPGQGIARDHMGVALGGVRTPWADCPVQIYSGVNDQSDEIDMLYGRTTALAPHALDKLYPGGLDDYMRRFESSLRRAVDAGFILEDDVQENQQLARALFPKSPALERVEAAVAI